MNHNNCRITVPEIPVFFSTDDNYIPFLDVALSSLIENASRDYRYRIMILNTGLSAETMARIRRCPVTCYLQVALLPLVPGAGIYDSMRYCVAGEMDLFLAKLIHTIGMAAALSVGAMLVSALVRTAVTTRQEKKNI